MRGKQALAAEVTRLGIPLTVNAVMHRANIDHVEEMVDACAQARRQARRDRACAVLRLGAEEPRAADADARAGRARREGGRAIAHNASRADRDRRGRAGLLRAFPQGLRRRLGAALAQRHAVRQGAAVPCGREHSGARHSGTCASIRSPTSGTMRRRSWRFAAPTGCRSLAARVRGRRKISAAAAARPSRSPAMRARPTRCATFRRTTRWSAELAEVRADLDVRLPAVTDRRACRAVAHANPSGFFT